MSKKKKQSKAKEPVKIRFKKLENGQSIYLAHWNGTKWEYEFLKLYIVPERTADDKEANAQTLRLANAIKAKKIVEFQNNQHGFSNGGTRSKVNLIEYVKMFADKKKECAGGEIRGNYQSYMALLYHLKQYGGDKTLFKHIDKNYCSGFIEYLKTAKSTTNGGKIKGTTEKPLSENTQHGYVAKFQTVINSAISDEMLNINPFIQIKPENKPKKHDADVCYLTIDEVKKLIETPCFYSNIKNGFLFSCFSGLRFSDVKGLTWDKLQKDAGDTFIKFIQKKTKKQEYLPITEAIKFLPERGTAAGNDFVFKFPSGGYVNLQLKQWVFMAGISKKVTFHVARHTNATLLLSQGVPIETVSNILGHSDIQTTQIYAKVIDKNKRAAMDKLNGLTD